MLPDGTAKNTEPQKKSKTGFLRSGRNFSKPQVIIFVLVFGVIGYALFKSFAAAPLVASMEAEQMTLPAGATVITDTSASGGKAIRLGANGTATGSVSFPTTVSSINIIAKASICQGSPNMTVLIDGNNSLTTSVGSTSWSNFAITPASPIAAGTHSLSISFSNYYAKTKGKNACMRVLYADVTAFYGPDAVTPAPTISLSASPSSVVAGQASILTWSSTSASSCIASNAWSGAEPTTGSVSTGAINQSSTYSLSCTGGGGTATASTTITVTAAPQPVAASFTASPTSGAAPLTVSFHDTSTGAPTSWQWNFGDGSSSTAQNPSHQYAGIGTYSISLMASNAASANTALMADLVKVTATSGVIDQMITPEGATIQIYSGITGGWTAQSIYNLLKPNAYQLSKIGPSLTIKVTPQYSSSYTGGITGSGCSYSGFQATIYLQAVADDSFSTGPDAVIAHEYGHAWTHYYLYSSRNCGSWNSYLSERGLLGDSRVNSNYMWDPSEMAAEDYRQLFGTSLAVSETSQMNYQIPSANTITGFKDWFTNSWGTP
jgi:PKD repeat protein